jgi:riboflavin transporter FmnP
MSDTKAFDEIESFFSRKIRVTIQIVGSAIFGALSLVLSLYVVPYLPRTPQGFAYFDPVSIIWVTCFLIFGPLAGILCSIIGMVVLFPFDPFTPIGPIMKFFATFSMIIVIYIFKRKNGGRLSQELKKPKTYLTFGALGLALRIIVMVILNIVVYLSFYGAVGLEFWIIIVILLNSLTSIWDLLIPYLLVFTTKLDEKFEIW